MKKVTLISLFLGIIIFCVSIVAFIISDVSSIWNTWGLQEDGSWIYPDLSNYLLLLLFKFVLYGLIPLFISFGKYFDDERRKKYGYYFLTSLNYWFLIILVLKLICDSVLEVDKIFGITIFNSIKDIQTLIGFIVTFIIKKNYKFEPSIIEKQNYVFTERVKTLFNKNVQKKSLSELSGENAKEDNDLKSGCFIYALYENNKLMKIGKAVYTGGIYKRMLQYYNINETGGLDKITKKNRDNIKVVFFKVDNEDEAWAVERRLQSDAYFNGESMPWENKKRN